MPTPGWDPYATAPEAYARVAGRFHAQAARDLVAATAPRYGSRVLDLGAGSGVAAAAAAAAVGPPGTVVALDPAAALVALARGAPARPVVGMTPGLPFGADSFDTVVANLMIGHVPDHRGALVDLARVLRPGGRLGLTTWGRIDDVVPDDTDERSAYATWDAVAAEWVDLDAVDDEVAAVLPWEDWFTDPAHVRAALTAAGLRVVECFGRAYRSPCSHTGWIERIDTGVRARAVLRSIGADRYAELRTAVARALPERGVPDPVPVTDELVVTVAVTGTGRS